MSPFTLLHDPATYAACDWNLAQDEAGRAYWVPFFKQHFRTILALAIESAVVRGQDLSAAEVRANACAADFDAIFDAFSANPQEYQRVTILTLDAWRDQTLRKHGYDDPFLDLKNRENERALTLLPQLCHQLDAIDDPRDQFRALVEGVFAGNIFD